MGFDIALDDKNQVSNVMIRAWFSTNQVRSPHILEIGSQSGDVHSVPPENGQSQAEYTRELWKLASS